MSTNAGSAESRGGLLVRAHRLFEVPAIFDLYQVVVDGGKRAPVSRFLEGVARQSVIDLGCGTGAWSYLANGRYMGLDYSSSFISGCRKRFRDEPDKRFEVGDLESIRLAETFDLALMMSVLHHLSDEQTAALLAGLERHAIRLLVMDLIPLADNPISQLLYHLDRGDYIRSVEAQRNILQRSGAWKVEREGSFYSYNRLYRHSLFLLRGASDDGDTQIISDHGAH